MPGNNDKDQAVVDYIASMTDGYFCELTSKLFPGLTSITILTNGSSYPFGIIGQSKTFLIDARDGYGRPFSASTRERSFKNAPLAVRM